MNRIITQEERRIRLELMKLGMNKPTMDILFDPAKVKALKVKSVGEGMASQVVKRQMFLPVYFYPRDVKIINMEIGHDTEYRYILKKVKRKVREIKYA